MSRFKKLIEECDHELYPGSNYSRLALNLHLYHLKCMGRISNNIFTILLKLLKDVFLFLNLFTVIRTRSQKVYKCFRSRL